MIHPCQTSCAGRSPHIAEQRPRFTATPEQHEQLLHTFIKVVEQDEIEAFLQLLADDVTLVADGGGERGAAIQILRGRESVAAFATGTYRHSPAGSQYSMPLINGQPAILARTADGRPDYALFLYGEGAKIYQ
jgi:RNA polymerase sigma-70 factor (ECF subfamily)